MKPDAFACWENELNRPGLISIGTMGGVANNTFFRDCMYRLRKKKTVVEKMAWVTTGPTHLTEVYRETGYPLTIYPSHYFIRDHISGTRYNGNGHCFANQLWGSTKGSYEGID